MYARKERAHEKLPSSPALDRPTTRAVRERKDSGSQPSVPPLGATTPTYVPGDSRMMQREFFCYLGIRTSAYICEHTDSFFVLLSKTNFRVFGTILDIYNALISRYIYTLYLSSFEYRIYIIFILQDYLSNQVL